MFVVRFRRERKSRASIMAVRRVRLRGPSEPSLFVFSEPDAGVERANSGRDLRTRSCRYAFDGGPRNGDVDRGSADFHPKSGRFASNSRLLPGRGFRTSCSIAIATAQMASHGTTIGISRVGTRYSPQGPHQRRLGRSRPRRSRDHARARTVAVRTPSPKRSSHCGRTNKPYFSTIARLESGAVEVSSLWRPAAKLRPLPLLPAWIERSIS